MPRAFLCHASEDKPTVERLARALVSNGIETFYDNWEIRAGDSLRQKIDTGIGECTHFIVVLSPVSIAKPWVNAELDAGFVARLDGRVRLIPLRLHLTVRELPPLLQGLLSPSIDNFDDAVVELVADIHGVTRRPSVGPQPLLAARMLPSETGLSAIASRIAAFFVENSETARRGDPTLPVAQLRELIDAPDDDLAEAVDDLEALGWVDATRALGAGSIGFIRVMPRPQLFAALDEFVKPWNPSADAKTIAAHMLSTPANGVVVQLLDAELGWGPRRMNPAVTLLVDVGAVEPSESMDMVYERYAVYKNTATRRFVRGG
jgi:hypothetical protein